MKSSTSQPLLSIRWFILGFLRISVSTHQWGATPIHGFQHVMVLNFVYGAFAQSIRLFMIDIFLIPSSTPWSTKSHHLFISKLVHDSTVSWYVVAILCSKMSIDFMRISPIPSTEHQSYLAGSIMHRPICNIFLQWLIVDTKELMSGLKMRFMYRLLHSNRLVNSIQK